MERVATNAGTRHRSTQGYPCVYMARINLRCLILGHSICALITSNASVGLDLKKVHRFGELRKVYMSIF